MSPAIHFVSKSKGRLTLVAVTLVALASAVGAIAYWTTSGTGTGDASNGTMTAPGQPTRSNSGSTVDLSWAPSTVAGPETIEYHVQRSTDPVTSWSNACDTTALSGTPVTSCTDTPVAGTYRYRVTAIFRSWTAEGPVSDAFLVAPSDVTDPSVTIEQAAGQADPTNSSPINFTAVFSESVTGFTGADVTLTGTAAATTAVVTELEPLDGTTYDVAVNGMTSDGTVIASIGAGVAQDAASNDNEASTSTDNTVTYETVAPSVTVNEKAGQADPTGALPILFTVTFSEPVTGIDATDLTRSGTATGGTVSITGSGASYEIELSGSPTNGTVSFTIAANKATDAAGNSNAASTSTDNTVTYDAVAPSVTINQAAGQSDPTNSSPINFTVVFSEPVTGFADNDVTLAGTAAATNAVVIEIAPNDGTTYDVVVSGMANDGTVTASIAANRASDAVGNSNTASTSTDNTVFYDTVAPSVTIEQAAGQADPTNSSPINFTVTFSEGTSNFTTGDVTLNGTALATTATVTGGPTSYNVAVTGMTAQGTVIATIGAGVASDAAGNTNTTSSSTDNTVTRDSIAPTVTINQATGQADPTNATPINFTVVFSETTSNFATGDVTLTGTAGATTATVTGSGTTYDVAVSGMTGQGTVVATIGAGVATDTASNNNTASTSTDNTVVRDTVGPSVTINQKSLAPAQADPTNASPINFTVVFNESVSDFATGDVTLSGTAGATTATVTGSGTTYNVAVTGMNANGTVTATIGAATATDAVGNANTASTSTDGTVTFTINYTFVVSNPGTQTAGTAFGGFTIQLQANGVNTPNLNGSAYTGAKTITFSGPAPSPSGAAPSYPATVTFTDGLATLPPASVTLRNAATTTLTATDTTASPAVAGTSASFTVNAGAAAQLAWTTVTTSGTPSNPCLFICTVAGFGNNGNFLARVSVTDALGNIVTAIGAGHTVTVTRVAQSNGGNFTAPTAGASVTLTISTTGPASSTVTFNYKSGVANWNTDTLTAAKASGAVYTSATAALNK